MFKRVFQRYVLGNPRRRRYFWKRFYEFVSSRYDGSDWKYMNYGYVPQGYERPRDCTNPDWAQTMLYSQLVGDLDLSDRDVLEVGSGRGGGTHYLRTAFQPKTIVGLDISEQNVKHSREFHQADGLSYEVGDAENLPYSDGRFDVVVNVESSHCYGDRNAFYKEVHRVLRTDGTFLIADLYARNVALTLGQEFASCGFEVVNQEEITQSVLRSLEIGRRDMVPKIVAALPRPMGRYFETFAGYPNTVVYESFKSGESVYLRHTLRKSR